MKSLIAVFGIAAFAAISYFLVTKLAEQSICTGLSQKVVYGKIVGEDGIARRTELRRELDVGKYEACMEKWNGRN
jgi:hypothetical protein